MDCWSILASCFYHFSYIISLLTTRLKTSNVEDMIITGTNHLSEKEISPLSEKTFQSNCCKWFSPYVKELFKFAMWSLPMAECLSFPTVWLRQAGYIKANCNINNNIYVLHRTSQKMWSSKEECQNVPAVTKTYICSALWDPPWHQHSCLGLLGGHCYCHTDKSEYKQVKHCTKVVASTIALSKGLVLGQGSSKNGNVSSGWSQQFFKPQPPLLLVSGQK